MSRTNETPLLKAALEYYWRGWSIIPIITGGRPPKGLKWKPYQAERPSEAQIREWFSGGKYDSLAVICGAVSGGLVVLDLDSQERCEWWRKEHGDLAQSLSTAKTRRGLHIYFRSEPFRKRNGNKIDLLCEGAYAVLPPSPNKEWLIPLNGELSLLNPFEWGLEQFNIKRPNVATNPTEHTEHTEQTEQTDTIVELGVELRKEILSIVDKTLPAVFGERNEKIFFFALYVRSLPGFWGVDPKQFRWAVEEWYRRALPNITTKDFLRTWLDFLTAWKRLKYKCIDVEQVFEFCLELSPPERIVRDHPDYPKLHILCVWCRELHNAHKVFDSVAYLGCRTMGKLLKQHPDTANIYFRILEAEGYIKIVEKGKMTMSGGIATRFKYISA